MGTGGNYEHAVETMRNVLRALTEFHERNPWDGWGIGDVVAVISPLYDTTAEAESVVQQFAGRNMVIGVDMNMNGAKRKELLTRMQNLCMLLWVRGVDSDVLYHLGEAIRKYEEHLSKQGLDVRDGIEQSPKSDMQNKDLVEYAYKEIDHMRDLLCNGRRNTTDDNVLSLLTRTANVLIEHYYNYNSSEWHW